MGRILELAGVAVVVAVLFLGLQHMGPAATHQDQAIAIKSGITETLAGAVPGEDTVAPETAISVTAVAGLDDWYVSGIVVTLSPSDNGSGVSETLYSYDQYLWFAYSGPLNISSDGTTIVYYYSADVSGNKEPVKSAVFSIDTTPPVSSADIEGSQVPAGWYVSDVTIFLSATDETSGVAYSEYSVDGGAWATYTAPLVIADDGHHNIQFRSSDLAGNVENIQSLTFSIDRKPPTTLAILDGTMGLNGWYVSLVTMTLLGNDSSSGVADTEYSFDRIAWTTYSVPITFSDDGVFTIYFWSADYLGNSEETKFVTIYIDRTAPVTTAELSGTGGLAGWYVSEVSVVLATIDTTSGTAYTEYSFDGNTWFTYYGAITIGNEGRTELLYRSVDYAGNEESPIIVSVLLDMTPPTTKLDTESYYSTGMIVLSADDQVSGVLHTYCTVDGVDWIEYSGPFQPTATGWRGVVEYYSIDNAGNQQETKSTVLLLTEVKVMSFVSYYPYPCTHAPLTSLDVYFIHHRHFGYTLVTRSWLLWYNIEVSSEISQMIPSLSIAPILPSDFQMKALTVWLALPSGEDVLIYVYLNRTCGGGRVLYHQWPPSVTVSFDGHAIALTNIPSGARVLVSVAVDYELSGSLWKSPADFVVQGYIFSTAVQTSGVYYSSYTLPVVSHGAKEYHPCHTHFDLDMVSWWLERREHCCHRW